MAFGKGELDRIERELIDAGAVPGNVEVSDDPIDILYNGTTRQIVDPAPQGAFKDDFEDLVERRQRAIVGPNGEHLDDFDQKFQEQQGEHAQLVADAPFARTTPPSVLQGILGNQYTLKPGEEIEVARWQGKDAETTSVTVTIGRIFDALLAVHPEYANRRPYAVLNWGTRGFNFEVEVDIGRGSQFTINASYASLILGLNPESGSNMTLMGALSFGPCVRTSPLYRTVEYSVAGNNAQQFVVIPPFAKNFSLYRSTVNTVNVAVYNYYNAALFTIQRPTASFETFMDPIPLPSDAEMLLLTNTGVGASELRTVFELGI